MPPKVLIVEDQPDLAKLYAKVLRNAGCETHQAFTLDEARMLLDSQQFNLLMCDVRVGLDSGLTLIRDYKDSLDRSGTHILMMSAESRYRSESDDLGVDFFFSKPISLAALKGIVNRLLGTL